MLCTTDERYQVKGLPNHREAFHLKGHRGPLGNRKLRVRRRDIFVQMLPERLQGAETARWRTWTKTESRATLSIATGGWGGAMYRFTFGRLFEDGRSITFGGHILRDRTYQQCPNSSTIMSCVAARNSDENLI
jgi:hypothetical protein